MFAEDDQDLEDNYLLVCGFRGSKRARTQNRETGSHPTSSQGHQRYPSMMNPLMAVKSRKVIFSSVAMLCMMIVSTVVLAVRFVSCLDGPTNGGSA